MSKGAVLAGPEKDNVEGFDGMEGGNEIIHDKVRVRSGAMDRMISDIDSHAYLQLLQVWKSFQSLDDRRGSVWRYEVCLLQKI